MSELLVYKASAGSGKTFTLAVEYIKLLILNPRAYRQILAVTFTNKATAEMKERILSQLYGIQTGDKGSEAYLNRIKEETGKTEQYISGAGKTYYGVVALALKYLMPVLTAAVIAGLAYMIILRLKKKADKADWGKLSK